MKTTFLRNAPRCFLTLLAFAAVGAVLPLHAAPPNILWLITEDMGPELGCYGTSQVATPILDDLASRGMRFSRAFTVTPVCSTSRSSFCTGMFASSIGAHQHRTSNKQPLPEGVRPITRWLEDAGYYTANMRGGTELNASGKVDWNFQFEGKPFMGNNWSELKDHQPFYAQINHSQSHRAFTSPKHADPAKVVIPPYYPDVPGVRQDWAAYLDEVTEVDGLIGGVLERLKADGLADNTIIFMFGDHGRAHMRGKQWPYDSGLSIPLITYVPPSLAQPLGYTPGSVSDELVASIDITATTLDLAGVTKPAKMQGRVLFGPHSEPAPEFLFATRDRCDMTMFRIRTVRDERYRYIRNFMPDRPFLNLNIYKESSYPMIGIMRQLHEQGKLDAVQDRFFDMTRPEEELYFIDADRYEINNLANSDDPGHRAALVRMRSALDKWIVDSGDRGQTPEDPQVGLDIMEAKIKTMNAADLASLRDTIAQQRHSPGISDYYQGYLEQVEAMVAEALSNPAKASSAAKKKQKAR